MCGEKLRFVHLQLLLQGSPPRVRGKATRSTFLRRCTRITPACAGKSETFVVREVSTGDHPRVCGEKSAWIAVVMSQAGSPPRVRGKAAKMRQKRYHVRITPACAGKRESCTVCGSFSWDHPRVCGEKLLRRQCTRCRWGSPPRVRGKAGNFVTKSLNFGITPACAGKRLRLRHLAGCEQDHPRVCGEKCPPLSFASSVPGSPPRVRGKAQFFR